MVLSLPTLSLPTRHNASHVIAPTPLDEVGAPFVTMPWDGRRAFSMSTPWPLFPKTRTDGAEVLKENVDQHPHLARRQIARRPDDI